MKFDVSCIITIMPIALATMMEHIGDISAIGATTGKNYISNPGLHRTLLGDGLATCLSAAFGGPANTTYGENTGVLALTKIYDPKVVRIAACFAILLSFIPKVNDILFVKLNEEHFYILRHQIMQYPTVNDNENYKLLLKPVSYTHLDVYKRQVNNNADLEFLYTPHCKIRNSSYEFAMQSKNEILRDF